MRRRYAEARNARRRVARARSAKAPRPLRRIPLRISYAINQAVSEIPHRVFPANMLPYDPSLRTFESVIPFVRDGGTLP